MIAKICWILLLFFSPISTTFLSPLVAQEPVAEEKTPAKIPNSIDELGTQQRQELRYALKWYKRRERNSFENVLTKYAPIDSPGIFEAHEALVELSFLKRGWYRRDQPQELPYVPDFEFLHQHLKHMRTLQPDSSVIELTEKTNAFEVAYHHTEGKRKSFQKAYDAWSANPLECKHLVHYYENIAKEDLPQFFRVFIEIQLDEAVEKGLLDEIVKVKRDDPSLPVRFKDPTPKQQQLVSAVTEFFEKYDIEKGIKQLERLSEHPNYSLSCRQPLEKLGLKKLKTTGTKMAFDNSKRPGKIKTDLNKKASGKNFPEQNNSKTSPKDSPVAENEKNDGEQPVDREAQLDYLRSVIEKSRVRGSIRIPRKHRKAFRLLVDIVFEGGEDAEKAKQIYDPTSLTTRRDILGISPDHREYIARKFYDAGNYDKVLMWADRSFGTQHETLAMWCIANLKAEKGDPKVAFEHIKHHQLDKYNPNPNALSGYEPELVKAKGMLLVANGHPLLALDLLKFYKSKFPDDQDAKDYLAKCEKQIQAEVK